MKLVLKILALPVLFVVKLICVLGNLLTNVVSYVIGLLLLVIGGSAIYCIVKALWQSLLILVVLFWQLWTVLFILNLCFWKYHLIKIFHLISHFIIMGLTSHLFWCSLICLFLLLLSVFLVSYPWNHCQDQGHKNCILYFPLVFLPFQNIFNL